jgi:GNAT superfamily N-acetyltransferase
VKIDRRGFWMGAGLAGLARDAAATQRPSPATRVATQADLEACVALVEGARRQLERYEPRFWKRAKGAAATTGAWFSRLLTDPQAVFLVAGDSAAIMGFLIARIQPTPPVYDAGGPTAVIDDFCVAEPERWRDVGAALLADARAMLRAKGVAQVVVVAPQKDRAKAEFLRAQRLSLASTWWTTPT